MLIVAASAARADTCAIQTVRSYPLTTGYETQRRFDTVETRVTAAPSSLCQSIIAEDDGTLSLPCPVDAAAREILQYDRRDVAPAHTRWRYIHTVGVFLTWNGRILASLDALKQTIANTRYLCRVNVGRSPGQLLPSGAVVP